MKRVLLQWVAVVAMASLAGPAVAQQETLATVLDRAGQYVVEFHRQLSGIVAEERYVQDVRNPPRSSNLRLRALTSIAHRELTSDFLLVRLVGAEQYVEFRDVFEVDGKPVRDRSERLVKLFLEPTTSTAEHVGRIVDESTRYNIGPLRRTINVPVLALMVLDPVNQGRFRFKRAGEEQPILADGGAAGDAPLSARVWPIEYREVRSHTIIRTTNERDMPASGRFWIDPDTGRVLRSELVAEDYSIRGVVDVSYQAGPIPGLLVPARMRERYDMRREGSRVSGIATYGRFRQFQVKVDEKIAPVK